MYPKYTTEEAQKAYFDQAQTGPAVSGGYTDSCKTAAEPTGLRIHQLQRIQERSAQEYQTRGRVIDILARHPEFEEFLEVLRSGLVQL